MNKLVCLLAIAPASLLIACGPGDNCEVTLTCEPPSGGGGDTSPSGGAGGTGAGTGQGGGGAGQGGAGGGAASTCDNGTVDPGEVCFTQPYAAYATMKNEAYELVIVDCDSDGDLDVITSDTSSSTLTSLQNDGAGALSSPISETTPVSEQPYGLALGELDTSNPGLEVVMTPQTNGFSTVYGFNTDCSFNYLRHFYHSTPGGTNVSWSAVTLRMDTTAPDDIAVSPLTISWSLNGGAGQDINDAEATEPRGLSAGDLDSDGNDDLVYVDAALGRFFWARSSGSSLGRAAAWDMSADVGVFDSDVADLDGDLRMDVAVVNHDTGTVSVFINNGNPSEIGFTKLGEFTVRGGSGVDAQNSRSIVLADIDADGDADAIVANANESGANGSVSILLNNGAGMLALATNTSFPGVATDAPLATRRRPYSVKVADMNGDGALG